MMSSRRLCRRCPSAPCTVIVSPAFRSPTAPGDAFDTFDVGVVVIFTVDPSLVVM